MSEIVYEGEFEISLEDINLNGSEGAIEVYLSAESHDYNDNALTFENANTLYQFTEDLRKAAEDAGYMDDRWDG